eukprot:gene26945-biopygen17520
MDPCYVFVNGLADPNRVKTCIKRLAADGND